jgi:hypothetical protein
MGISMHGLPPIDESHYPCVDNRCQETGCQSTDDNETEPGTKTQVTDAVNTRMDVYDHTNNKVWNNKSGTPECASDGTGCPAKNTSKDMVRTETYVIDTAPTETVAPAAPDCNEASPSTGGELTLGEPFVLHSSAKGFQRDDCHYQGTCQGGNVGSGTWDYAGYMAKHHPGVTSSAVGGTTRYAVYQWERDNDAASNTLAPRLMSATQSSELKKIKGKDRKVWTFTKQCAYSRPLVGNATYGEQKDRRVLPIVAANCENLRGKGAAYEDYTLLRVFDVFLTEPSLQRSAAQTGKSGATVGTDNKEIYGEVIGPAETFDGSTGFQYYARNKPYLIR